MTPKGTKQIILKGLTPALHQAIKTAAAAKGMSMKDYILWKAAPNAKK